jgi:hypothetical protein
MDLLAKDISDLLVYGRAHAVNFVHLLAYEQADCHIISQTSYQMDGRTF